MKKNYLIIGIVVIVLVAVLIIIRSNKDVPYSISEKEKNPEKVNLLEKPQAPRELVSINEQLNAISTMNVDKMMENYADNAELDWQGAPAEGKYQGKEKIREFWAKFFDNAQIPASDSRDFQTKDRTASAFFSITRTANGKAEVLEKGYQVQFDDRGKIIKEVWGPKQPEAASQENVASEGEVKIIFLGKVSSVSGGKIIITVANEQPKEFLVNETTELTTFNDASGGAETKKISINDIKEGDVVSVKYLDDQPTVARGINLEK